MTELKKENKIGLKEILLIAGLLLIVFLVGYFWKDYADVLTHKDKLESWINSFGLWKYSVFILLQFIQVVIFVIPGELVHIAGGYIFGALIATFLSMTGIMLGSIACFIFARVLGQPLIEKFISEEKLEKLKKKLNERRLNLSLFIIFIIPGLPGKDAFAYVAGLTPMKFLDFCIVTLVARTPWVAAASFWGSSLEKGHYDALIIITLVSALLFIVGVFRGEKILDFVADKKKRVLENEDKN